jgi:hypothetical protein
MLSSSAISNLKPSQLSFSLTSVFHRLHQPHSGAADDGASPELALSGAKPTVQDLTRSMQDMGLKLVGEIWGLRLGVGEPLSCSIRLV